jgi:hypothetical protein
MVQWIGENKIDKFEEEYRNIKKEEVEIIDIHMKDIAREIYIREEKYENGKFNYSTLCTQKEYELLYSILNIISENLKAETDMFIKNYEESTVDFSWTEIEIPALYKNSVLNENSINYSFILERY